MWGTDDSKASVSNVAATTTHGPTMTALDRYLQQLRDKRHRDSDTEVKCVWFSID